MSETPSESTEAAVEPAGVTPNDVAPKPEGDEFKSEHSKKAVLADLAKERDERQKLQAQLDKLEQASLSDLEKAQKAATAAERRLAEIESTALRQKVAIEKGVPAKWVDRLRGSTEEELAADADLILADLTQSPTTPKPDLSQGSQGTPPPASAADKFAAAFEGRL